MDGGGAHELKLLGSWASPYVARVKLALHLKGVHYSYAEEDLADKSDLLLRSNPVHKAVPVLIHNGRPVCESQVIMQYLDEASPASARSSSPPTPTSAPWPASGPRSSRTSCWCRGGWCSGRGPTRRGRSGRGRGWRRWVRWRKA
ncbi:hypothetical protein ACQ4PT_044606 [Festuca glaucescens]